MSEVEIQNLSLKHPDLYSNSRRDVWFRCEQLHDYVYQFKKRGSESRQMLLGTYIHELLEKIYQYLIDFNDGAWMDIPYKDLVGICTPLPIEDEFILRAKAAVVVMDYWKRYAPRADKEIRILAVEEKIITPLTTPKGRNIEFVQYIDLVYMSEITGELWIMDHKSGKLWTTEEANRQGQQAIYLANLRSLGRPVVGAVINNISSSTPKVRRPAHELFQRLTIKKSDVEIESIMANLLQVIDRMIDHKDDPVMNLSTACVYCAYDPVCQLRLKGREDLAVRTLKSMPDKTDSQVLREQERIATMERLKVRTGASIRQPVELGFSADFDIEDDDEADTEDGPDIKDHGDHRPGVLATPLDPHRHDDVIDIRDFKDILDD